ncbi:ABC transporter ATP-binding protein [Enterococcus sp. JM4C]|uniref:ABC transporter ATP-binding protein n=1 Tax=Candidatus Enterococcus huntleyi TaxID=1857217 RepID=UPI0013799E8C|nr:ABC transporter ATP-binding protein [Enterococcus sp. JM4C]KAF1296567.1 ABC transporter ATP-binding protein [Enterococcus sp. JM4C]
MTKNKAIVLENVTKSVEIGESGKTMEILHDISLEAEKGEFLSIIGASGSGKTSLLHCMSGLSIPTKGQVTILDVHPYELRASKIAAFRRTKIGFIFQAYNLLPALPAFENIVLPLRLAGKKIDKQEILSLLDQLKFHADITSFVDALSGGEQQKIAIARVLVANCEVVFADEPTGALDSVSGKIVFDLLRYLANQGVCVIMVTHDIELAANTDRAIIMKDGQLVHSISKPFATQLFEAMSEETRPA